MPISITVSNDNAELVLNDIKSLFPQLAAGLPPMQEQPIREPAPPVNDNPAPKKTRGKKGESEAPLPADGAASSTVTEGASASAESTEPQTLGGETEKVEIPDIELVRAKLKQMGATDGLGHDKVFETLAHYKSKDDDKQPAKSASTLRPADYIALIAEIDALLAGVSK